MFEFDRNGRILGAHKCHAAPPGIHKSRPLKPRPPALAEHGFDISSVSKAFIEKIFKESYKCPVCSEKFATESSYYQHLRQKRSIDDQHEQFYRDNGQIIEHLDTSPLDVPSDPSKIGSLKPEKVTAFPEETSAINRFGGIQFKGKDGQSKRVRNYKDWWDEFSGNEDGSCDSSGRE
ncbi:MAG TPA: hypothetical protein VKM55_24940 [Candidatus Lokiarchaeia archaeon]|nr:hypothetical protein [Candidatus Lokiarchaeia archaeon]